MAKTITILKLKNKLFFANLLFEDSLFGTYKRTVNNEKLNTDTLTMANKAYKHQTRSVLKRLNDKLPSKDMIVIYTFA